MLVWNVQDASSKPHSRRIDNKQSYTKSQTNTDNQNNYQTGYRRDEVNTE